MAYTGYLADMKEEPLPDVMEEDPSDGAEQPRPNLEQPMLGAQEAATALSRKQRLLYCKMIMRDYLASEFESDSVQSRFLQIQVS